MCGCKKGSPVKNKLLLLNYEPVYKNILEHAPVEPGEVQHYLNDKNLPYYMKHVVIQARLCCEDSTRILIFGKKV